jgi:hypothetical protein
VFTKNRERLVACDIAAKFLAALLGQPPVKALLSDEQFPVGRTLIKAWASMKSFKPKDDTGGGDTDGRGSGAEGQRPSKTREGTRARFPRREARNATHASTTDPYT